MKIPKNVLTVLILHKSLKWSKVSLSSFLEIFDGDLVIIDNNFKKDGLESEYVKNTFGITPLFNNKPSKIHGSGLDFAFDYAKKNNYDHILHIEPDCVFYDTIWFDKLYNEFLKSNKETQVYHYSNQGKCSWFYFTKEIIELSNINCKVMPIAAKDYLTPAKRPINTLLNKGKISQEFGVSIPFWKDSLRNCLERFIFT